MGQRYTGNIEVICPRCKQAVSDESVPGPTVVYVRRLMKKLVNALRREYPWAKIKTVDPLEVE